MESALPEVQRNDELQFVTRHFADLQGLRFVPFWATFVLLCALEYAHAATQLLNSGLGLVLLALAAAWSVYAGRWYRRRYGLVTPGEERVHSQVFSILQADWRSPETAWRPRVWLVAWIAVGALFVLSLFLHRPEGGIGLVGLIWVLLPKAFITGPSTPWIRGRLLLAIGGSTTIYILQIGYLLGHLNGWVYMGAAGTVLLLVCLYDHWLLSCLLNRRSGEGCDE